MKLVDIQKQLNAPKNQYNSFGKYNYRSCEDILEAVKPLLKDKPLLITDDIFEIGGRIYVKASVSYDGQTVTAYAREPEVKKGMDSSQITGASSSYARKYALAGLFLLDDNKDADTMKPPKEVKSKVLKDFPDKRFAALIQSVQDEKITKDKAIKGVHSQGFKFTEEQQQIIVDL